MVHFRFPHSINGTPTPRNSTPPNAPSWVPVAQGAPVFYAEGGSRLLSFTATVTLNIPPNETRMLFSTKLISTNPKAFIVRLGLGKKSWIAETRNLLPNEPYCLEWELNASLPGVQNLLLTVDSLPLPNSQLAIYSMEWSVCTTAYDLRWLWAAAGKFEP